jgi:anaerobic selenocysteine-containing dehydrogenase
LVALVLLGVVGLVGCGSRSPSTHESTTPTASSPTTPSPSGPSNSAAVAKITENWETFFSKDTPASQKLALLQDGSKLQQAIAIFSSDPRLKQASAKVVKVEMTSSDQATVTYDILLNGATALPNAQGTAILQDGTWKVSDASFCALAALGHSGVIPGCS